MAVHAQLMTRQWEGWDVSEQPRAPECLCLHTLSSFPTANGDGTKSTQNKHHSGSCDFTEYLLLPGSHGRLLAV